MADTLQIETWRDNILYHVAHDICETCTDPRKDRVNIDLGNPLECKCRCERVNPILERMEQLNDDLLRSK